MRWLEHRLPPPLLALLLGWAMQAGAAWPPALPWPRAVAWPLMASLVLAGLVCDLSGLQRFLRVRTTINPLRPQNSSVLVTGDARTGIEVSFMWVDKDRTEDGAAGRALVASATCAASTSGMARQTCCPAAAGAVPSGTRCANFTVVP